MVAQVRVIHPQDVSKMDLLEVNTKVYNVQRSCQLPKRCACHFPPAFTRNAAFLYTRKPSNARPPCPFPMKKRCRKESLLGVKIHRVTAKPLIEKCKTKNPQTPRENPPYISFTLTPYSGRGIAVAALSRKPYRCLCRPEPTEPLILFIFK